MNSYLQKLSLNTKPSLKSKIEKHFKHKPTKQINIRVGKYTSLIIVYMYGNKYSLRRLYKGKEQLITVLTDIDNLIKLIAKEKHNAKLN